MSGGITVDVIAERVFSMLSARPKFKEDFEKLIEAHEGNSDNVMNDVYKQYPEVKLLAVVNHVHESSEHIKRSQDYLKGRILEYEQNINIIKGKITDRRGRVSGLSNGSKRKVKGSKIKPGLKQQQMSPDEKRAQWNDEITKFQNDEKDVMKSYEYEKNKLNEDIKNAKTNLRKYINTTTSFPLKTPFNPSKVDP